MSSENVIRETCTYIRKFTVSSEKSDSWKICFIIIIYFILVFLLKIYGYIKSEICWNLKDGIPKKMSE